MNNNHLSALKIKHSDIESRIERESHRPQPDEGTLHALKKQKLQIKDQINREAMSA